MSRRRPLCPPVEAGPSPDAHERRLAALDAFLVEYESVHGEITVEEMDAAARRTARSRASNQPAGPANAE